MANGAGWSALGAAILGGQQAFRQRTLDNQQTETHKAQLTNERLQQQLLMDKINELPQQHAEGDVKRYTEQYGDDRFNIPGFLDASQKSGLTIPTMSEQALMQPRLQQIEGGSGGPVESGDQVANRMGVAPNTRAILPSGVKLQKKIDEQKGQQADAITSFMQAMGGTGGGQMPQPGQGGPLATTPGSQARQAAPPFENPQERNARIMGKLTGIDPNAGVHESPEHKVFTANLEAEQKAKFRPPAATIQREIDAYKKARLLIPDLRQALMTQVMDQNDPTGQNANPVAMLGHLAKQRARSFAYGQGYPIDDTSSKAQQLAGLLKVVGATPYMNGSRSMQMFSQVADHLTDRHMTPEAQLQRLNELEQIFPEFEQAVEKGFVPGQTNQPPAAPPKAGMPQAGISIDNAQSAMPAAAPRVAVKAGDTVPYAEVAARAAKLGQDPNKFAAALMAQGVKVTK